MSYYYLTVEINGYRRMVGKPMTEEGMLKVLEEVPGEWKPELVECVPPREERGGRTTRPSTVWEKERGREWKRVGLRKCVGCGAVNQIWESYRTGVRKCWECGVIGGRGMGKSMAWMLKEKEER